MERASGAGEGDEVEESIEFEEESEESPYRDVIHSVSRTNLHNPAHVRAPRTQAENARRRGAANAVSRGAPGKACVCMSHASVAVQPIMSPGRQGHAGRGVMGDKTEPHYTERLRHERELRIKGVNPGRGLAKLPDSPVHFKHPLPLADGEECFAMPMNQAPEGDLGWCQDLRPSLPASPSLQQQLVGDQPPLGSEAAALWHNPPYISGASAATGGSISQGPWNLQLWPPRTGDGADALTPLDMATIDGYEGVHVARAPRFLDDEVEEDIDEDELLRAFGRRECGMARVGARQGAVGCIPCHDPCLMHPRASQ